MLPRMRHFLMSLAILACSCAAEADSPSPTGAVATFFRSDVDGDGALSDDELANSGADDANNTAGFACPLGWEYAGKASSGEPVCALLR
jgi:hypothetical protein